MRSGCGEATSDRNVGDGSSVGSDHAAQCIEVATGNPSGEDGASTEVCRGPCPLIEERLSGDEIRINGRVVSGRLG